MKLIYEIFKIALSPVFITFCAVFLGYYIGRIQIKNISFGLSGVLIISAAFGFLYFLINQRLGADIMGDFNPQEELKLISSLGSAIFISSIGLSSGYKLKSQKGIARVSLLSGAVVAANLIIMRFILVIDSSVLHDVIYGVFCGAMTSSPGLAALLSGNINAERAGIGYGMSYLIGVLGIVMFVQIKCRKYKAPFDKDAIKVIKENDSTANPTLSGIVQMALAIMFGYVLGNISIPILNISLGVSGGILISSLIIGIKVSGSRNKRYISESSLTLLRNFGLSIFFVGNGFCAGSAALSNLSLRPLLYGAMLALFPILATAIAGKTLLKKESDDLTAIVCGVMTSTPAITVLLSKTEQKEEIMTLYMAAYTGALITTVIFMSLIGKVF